MILDSKGNGRSETLGAGANGETNSYAAASSADNGRRTAGTSPNGSSAVTQSSPEDRRGVQQSSWRADAPGSALSADSPVGVLPALSLPKGGGALRGIGEKFAVNAATGSASFSIPVGVSPGRDGFGPSLELNYSAGAGNSVYGAGWQLGVPSISRRTEKGLPRYLDAIESDVFVLSGAEELVPALDDANFGPAASTEGQWRVRRYRPRVETDFSRVERWTHQLTGDVHWQVTSRDNITRVFGRSAASRIVDPKQPARIFSWLLEETRDDRGNVTLFEYKAEDGAGVSALHVAERARFEFAVDGAATFTATSQRYLKRISYGNRQPFVAADFMFQLVLDYGEHLGSLPTPNEAEVWPVRQDPFSTHRAGFDVRSYRLCQRFLMFHQFPELGNQAELVRSTMLQYRPSRTLTKLLSVVHTGHGRASDGSPTAVALPAVTLDYTEPVLHTQLTFLPEASLTGIRGGVETNGGSVDPSNNGRTQWVDLDGEGIPGVLLASDSALYYKRNLGAARLTSAEVLSRMPVGSAGSSDLAVATRSQLTDWNGDGRLEWVEFRPERVSAYTRKADCACDPEADFTPYYTLPRAPNLDWNDPNLRFVDLDGDGRADLLITEHDCFVWYQFREQEGYAAPQVLSKAAHEDQGPTVVFASRTEGIQLVDMCGDGLVDVVRVRNGEVCYWPNLGYGRFGKKITLAGSPHFAEPDQFDPSRVRFADVDGSGSADVLYVGAKGVSLWSNEAGNALSAEQPLTGLPSVDLASQVSFVDLFGNGTACLVWSSPWRNGVQPVAYVDLMGGLKPHLLISIVNNLGSETRIRHRSSVDYYLQDKEAGKPWLTRLPFPVQVVDRVEHFDRVAGSRLVQRYQYHHGFYDGVEREFRGFAMVEQFDAEVFGGARGVGLFPEAPAAERSAPPVHTKTWFHTGAYLEAACLERELAREYFAQDPDAPLLPDTVLPAGLAPRERREAARALRGQVLRQEVYADDDSVLARVPYSVSEANYSVRREQPRQGEVPGVFFTHPSTRLTLNYERNIAAPRTSQECVIDVDAFGNVRGAAMLRS
jgi:Salmonella virulence plasmid 65kDa B protein/Insecticide toxin TcdB middle/N-terminal region/Insecticide toxin TcdB middle/C-terminal region